MISGMVKSVQEFRPSVCLASSIQVGKDIAWCIWVGNILDVTYGAQCQIAGENILVVELHQS
jgi:hypothetical protein